MATALPFANPTNDSQYAEDLDVELGAPFPVNPAAVAVTSAWVQSESPTFPGWNGLGTELDLSGAKPDPSNPAVFDYPTLQEGLAAAVDELAGKGPQTNALDPQFVKDVASNKASSSQLVSDVLAGDWDGQPDTYDATAIANKLKSTTFSVSGSTADPANASTSSLLGGLGNALVGPVNGGAIVKAPLTIAGDVASSALGGIAGTVGVYILKGVLTLIGGAMFVYGATLLTDRKVSAGGSGSAAPAAGGESALGAIGPEDLAVAA